MGGMAGTRRGAFLALVTLASSLFCAGCGTSSHAPRDWRPAEITREPGWLYLHSGEHVEGEILAVLPDSVFFHRSDEGRSTAFTRSDVASFAMPATARGLRVYPLLGATAGCLIGLLIGSSEESRGMDQFMGEEFSNAAGATVGAGAGLLAGFGAALLFPPSDEYEFSSKPPDPVPARAKPTTRKPGDP